ncbi:MAG: hypothetical protein IJM24_01965 [Clostridia bacterium]|nr:hypothetical protein [Clostridia bacterium]
MKMTGYYLFSQALSVAMFESSMVLFDRNFFLMRRREQSCPARPPNCRESAHSLPAALPGIAHLSAFSLIFRSRLHRFLKKSETWRFFKKK